MGMILKPGETYRDRAESNIRKFGEWMAEHAATYANAIGCHPCCGYTITFTDAGCDEWPTVRLEVEQVDKSIQ